MKDYLQDNVLIFRQVNTVFKNIEEWHFKSPYKFLMNLQIENDIFEK